MIGITAHYYCVRDELVNTGGLAVCHIIDTEIYNSISVHDGDIGTNVYGYINQVSQGKIATISASGLRTIDVSPYDFIVLRSVSNTQNTTGNYTYIS